MDAAKSTRFGGFKTLAFSGLLAIALVASSVGCRSAASPSDDQERTPVVQDMNIVQPYDGSGSKTDPSE